MDRAERATQRSRAVVEAARETDWQFPSVTAALFKGELLWDLLHPFPAQDADDAHIGDAYLETLGGVLDTHVDPDEIDRTGVYPPAALTALAEADAFGMRIDQEYGGLGLSLTNYCRALAFIGSHCQSTLTYVSAHQSVGAPQPLQMFGTDAQRGRFLPRLARGELSAFALTEPDVGSDPARMTTTATLTPDGDAYLLNGRKLWCTNGPVAGVLVVLAKTPSKLVAGRGEVPQITCFIIEKDTPGLAIEHTCSFMGLRGISNGVITFENVRVPVDNVIGQPGEGLRIALATLNVGRVAAAAATVGGAKIALTWMKQWANDRVQWGRPIGQHQAIAKRIATMAANTFAMDAIVTAAAGLADRGQTDIRLEAAIAKYFCTETAWNLADDAVQVRGGRGYETAESLRRRGEAPVPVERMLRDARIGRVLEGSSEIMRLVIAREALDVHLQLLLPLLAPVSGHDRTRAAVLRNAVRFYASWYPRLWRRQGRQYPAEHLSPRNREHLAFVEENSRKLARALFHTMVRYRQKLETKQLILANFVDIGVDLFAMAATIAFTEHTVTRTPEDASPQDLADLFCSIARERIARNFHAAAHNHNRSIDHVADAFLHGTYDWLHAGAHTMNPRSAGAQK